MTVKMLTDNIAEIIVSDDIKNKLNKMKLFFTVSDQWERFWEINNKIYFDKNLTLEPYIGFLAGDRLFKMGAFSYSWSQMPEDILIGRYCSIAAGVQVSGSQHPMETISTHPFVYDRSFDLIKHALMDYSKDNLEAYYPPWKNAPIIENDVWIGEGALLMRGIKIGTGAVIAARAVVTKDVPPYAIVGGVPASIIRYRFDQAIISELLSSQWWKYHFGDFKGLSFNDPKTFLKNLENLTHKIPYFDPDSINIYNQLTEK